MLGIQIMQNDDSLNIIAANQKLQNIDDHLSYYSQRNSKLPLKPRNEKNIGKAVEEEEN